MGLIIMKLEFSDEVEHYTKKFLRILWDVVNSRIMRQMISRRS